MKTRSWSAKIRCVALCVCAFFTALHATEESAAERIRSLRAQIAHHDELYFKKNRPEITDGEYDALKRELAALEKNAGIDGSASPAKVGDDRAGNFATHRHGAPMLSLEKAYSEANVRAFCARVERVVGQDHAAYVIEPKFDGVAISVTYENGKLARAATRGDGRSGDDVTDNVLAIAAIPHELRAQGAGGKPNAIPESVELRGEIFLTQAEFARINAERAEAGEELFATPRNLAAGSLKQRSPADVAKRNLSAVFYGMGEWREAAAQTASVPSSQQALYARLEAWGMPRIEPVSVAKTADEVWGAIRVLGEQRASFPFPVDGLVVKLDAVANQRALGSGNEAPRWAVAYKFAPERISTRLRAITFQVGRTGVITPVAELAPVEIGGTRVSRATLHNADEIARRDLRVGDYVYLEKAGDVIPAITGVDLERRQAEATVFEFPVACPSCGSALVRKPADAAIYCENAECPAQLRRRVEHFAAPSGMGIKGLGPALIEAMVRQKSIKTVADIYRLKTEDFITPKSAKKILAQIEQSKRAPLGRLIYALSLPGVGRMTANALAERFETLDAFADASAEELRGVEGVGAATAEMIGDALADSRNQTLMADLLALGVGLAEVNTEAKTPGESLAR